MMPTFTIFAGPIFTKNQWTAMLIGFFFIVTLAVALSIYGAAIVIARKKHSERTRFIKSFIIAFAVVAVAVLLLIVLPTARKDAAKQANETYCAKLAGYDSPSEDNTSAATSTSQRTFRACLQEHAR